MTIRELMRVTGIDPAKELRSYKTAGVSEKQLGAMLGNSVPVPLIQGVLESVLRAGGLKRKSGRENGKALIAAMPASATERLP